MLVRVYLLVSIVISTPPEPAWCRCRPSIPPVLQSLAALHAAPPAHRGQLVTPPQSTALSPPFFTLSVHEAVAHFPPAHTPL